MSKHIICSISAPRNHITFMDSIAPPSYFRLGDKLHFEVRRYLSLFIPSRKSIHIIPCEVAGNGSKLISTTFRVSPLWGDESCMAPYQPRFRAIPEVLKGYLELNPQASFDGPALRQVFLTSAASCDARGLIMSSVKTLGK